MRTWCRRPRPRASTQSSTSTTSGPPAPTCAGRSPSMELVLARLFGSAFPRKGIDFSVRGMGGPRLLSVDELEQVRDSLATRIQEVRTDLHDHALVEEANRELIEQMTADPASHKWVRVYNEDIGEPGCKNWHAKPKWGPLGMLLGWWRVKISSGCPLAEGLRPPECSMATKRQRRKRRRERGPGAPGRPAPPVADASGSGTSAPDRRRAPLAQRDRLADGRAPTRPRHSGAASRSRRSSSSSASSCWSSASSSHRRRAS